MTLSEDWAEKAPDEVWHILEDWGYFREDVNLTDVIHLTKYLLHSLTTEERSDYYWCLQFEDGIQYYKMRFDCISFLYYFEKFAIGKGMLEE